ncbi:transposase, partial [Janthinobacterium sp. LB3P118]|uniref:transposase n=1 Tax=Janthinobacterium sp. LB3P118 TaxID=3424195 RepID=UPI003F20D05F
MTKYNEQFKLTVVRQYLDGRQGYKSVANDHLLHHVVVKRWVDRYRLHGIAGLQKKFSHYDAEFKLAVLQRMWDE